MARSAIFSSKYGQMDGVERCVSVLRGQGASDKGLGGGVNESTHVEEEEDEW